MVRRAGGDRPLVRAPAGARRSTVVKRPCGSHSRRALNANRGTAVVHVEEAERSLLLRHEATPSEADRLPDHRALKHRLIEQLAEGGGHVVGYLGLRTDEAPVVGA